MAQKTKELGMYNLRDITTPVEGLVVRKDAWWACKDGDPKQAIFYGKAPQCNSMRSVIEWGLGRDQWKPIQNVQPVFVEVAFIPDRND